MACTTIAVDVCAGELRGVSGVFDQKSQPAETVVSDESNSAGEVDDQLRREVEERREAERAARESEQLYRALIEQAIEGVWVAELETHEIVDANPAFCDYVGHSREELIGRRIDDFLDRTDEEMAFFERKIREEGEVGPMEGGWITPDGEVVDVQVTANLIRLPDRDLVCTIGRDVRDKRRLQAQLEMSDRLASIGTLAAGIAHELNNPLAYLITNLHYLEEETERWREAGEPPDLEEWRTVLSQSKGGVERMRKIVDDLRAFYRSENHEVEGVDVRDIVDAVLELATSDLPEGAEVVKEYGDVPLIEANSAALEQAFLNILVNAVQALGEAEVREREHRIEIETERTDDGAVAVAISDTGVGIAPDHLDRVFDPFFTTKPVDVGTGLGLSMAHSIIHSFGGEITVESEEGVGSTFRVYLPTNGEVERSMEEPPWSDRL